jgi:glycosyltransferase involved in cell wall biosynthesis
MLTVVIPAYNVETYIGTCLRSVLDQTRTRNDVRVIVVLDGPTDSTADQVKRTIDGYPGANVEILAQSNQGLSTARNVGIEAARTEYIAFLDADDYWLPGYLDAVLTELAQSSPDMLEYDTMLVDEKGAELYSLRCSSGPAGRIAAVDAAAFASRFRCYAWCRVYKTRLFAERHFPAGHRFEDTATIPWLYWRAQHIVSMPKPLIVYRQRGGSILASPTEADIHDIATYAEEAAVMFNETRDLYWRDVALRIFQQACSRIERLPANRWADLIRMAKSPSMRALPVPKSLARWLQMRQTRFYIRLLSAKRRFVDTLVAAHRQFTHRPSLRDSA